MAYHPLATESGGTADDRRAEATRILKILADVSPDEFTGKETEFLDEMEDNNRPVSAKQLYWLRDIKAKYAE